MVQLRYPLRVLRGQNEPAGKMPFDILLVDRTGTDIVYQSTEEKFLIKMHTIIVKLMY